MKKLITLFIIMTITLAASFASTINILSSVDLQHLSATIVYNENTSIENNDLEIVSEFNLDEEIEQSTKAFSVLVDGNTNETETLTIEIEASAFASSTYTTSIIPSPTAVEGYSAFANGSQDISLEAGVYNQELASQFTLNWMGQSELPNGDYYSTITMNIVNPN